MDASTKIGLDLRVVIDGHHLVRFKTKPRLGLCSRVRARADATNCLLDPSLQSKHYVIRSLVALLGSDRPAGKPLYSEVLNIHTIIRTGADTRNVVAV